MAREPARHGACAAPIFACLAILVCGTACRAQTQTDLLSRFDNFSIRDAPDPPPPGGDKFYAATGPGGHWGIDQWNIPGPRLTPFATSQSGGATVFSTTAPESTVTITRGPADTLVSLSQNGAVLPCDTASGKPRESDLFIGSAVKTPGLAKIPLSQLSRLLQYVKISVQSGPAATEKGCRANKGGAVVSVILRDTSLHPGQTFFYQLILSGVCREETGSAPCRKSVGAMTYYATKNPFGANDYLPQLGVNWVGPGALTDVRVDLLPRLTRAILTGPPSLDHDLSHWTVNSAYGGQIIFGDVTMASQWQDYRLIAEQK